MDYLHFFTHSDSTKIMNTYHTFVDTKTIGGIPNFMNIVSNGSFLIPFLYLYIIIRKSSKSSKRTQLFLGLILCLAVSSGYYHTQPTNDTITLDMLCVISIYLIVVSYFVTSDVMYLLVVIGISSVLYWNKTRDLRLYELLKIIIPIYCLYKLHTTRAANYLFPLLFISIAVRLCEYNDSMIYRLTGNTISGHSLKHIVAAFQLCVIIRALQVSGKLN